MRVRWQDRPVRLAVAHPAACGCCCGCCCGGFVAVWLLCEKKTLRTKRPQRLPYHQPFDVWHNSRNSGTHRGDAEKATPRPVGPAPGAALERRPRSQSLRGRRPRPVLGVPQVRVRWQDRPVRLAVVHPAACGLRLLLRWLLCEKKPLTQELTVSPNIRTGPALTEATPKSLLQLGGLNATRIDWGGELGLASSIRFLRRTTGSTSTRRGHGSTRSRGHVGTWAEPGYFVPAGPASLDHPMQRATIIRSRGSCASRAGTGRAAAIGPRRRAAPPPEDRAPSDAQGRYDAERRRVRILGARTRTGWPQVGHVTTSRSKERRWAFPAQAFPTTSKPPAPRTTAVSPRKRLTEATPNRPSPRHSTAYLHGARGCHAHMLAQRPAPHASLPLVPSETQAHPASATPQRLGGPRPGPAQRRPRTHLQSASSHPNGLHSAGHCGRHPSWGSSSSTWLGSLPPPSGMSLVRGRHGEPGARAGVEAM